MSWYRHECKAQVSVYSDKEWTQIRSPQHAQKIVFSKKKKGYRAT